MALTDLAIKHAKAKNRPYTMTDGGGLGIEVSPAGGKVWRWRFRYDGKHQTLTIGKYPSISIAKARLARDEAREQVHAGYHPSRVKQAQKLRRMAENETTFESVARKWHDVRGNGLNKKYHTQILSRMEQYVFPLIGAFPRSRKWPDGRSQRSSPKEWQDTSSSD